MIFAVFLLPWAVMAITQAILPVAGLGTRFLPWTKSVPKEMLPIGNQPIIAHIVDECVNAGITDICFVIAHGKEMIPQYFYEHPQLEEELRRRGKLDELALLQKYDHIDFHVVYQEEQLGDGHAILQAADWVRSDPVAILFGDDLFTGKESGLQQIISAYEQLPEEERGAIVSLENLPDDIVPHKGIVDVDVEHATISNLKKIKGLVEKPKLCDAPSNLGIVGRYIIPRSTFDVLPTVAVGYDEAHSTGAAEALLAAGNQEIRLIDALRAQLSTVPIYGLECTGTRLDTGTPEGYVHAVQVITGNGNVVAF